MAVDDAGDNDTYFAVLHSAGVVYSYTERLVPGASIGEARQAALNELPPDAKVEWFVTKATCAQEEITSAILATSGFTAAFVEFSTATATGDSAYTSTNANELLFLPGSYPKVSDAPDC